MVPTLKELPVLLHVETHSCFRQIPVALLGPSLCSLLHLALLRALTVLANDWRGRQIWFLLLGKRCSWLTVPVPFWWLLCMLP